MKGLKALFGGIFLSMLVLTTIVSLRENVLVGLRKVLAEPWAFATLADAYFGFITFYAWVFYKEASGLARGIWFVAIMLLGNIAMSFYVLRELFRLPAGAGPETLLLRRRE